MEHDLRSGSFGGELAPPRTAGIGRRLRPLAPYALLAPALAVLAAVLAWPLYRLVAISLQQYGLRELFQHRGRFLGLANYRTVLTDPFFWTVVVRTVAFAGVCVGLTMVAGTLIALLLRRVGRRMRVLVQAGLVFAWATPVLSAVSIWQWLFDYEFGVVNWLLVRLGADGFARHNWFDDPWQGWLVIVLVVVWGAIPFVAVTLHAGLSQVPAELVDAARVDGAGPWQVFWKVTFPLLKPIFLILVTLSTIWDFRIFTQVWVMLNQRPTRDYFLLGIYSFNTSFGVTRYGLGAAIAVVMVLLLVVLTSLYVRQLLRTMEEAAA
jgi:N,N'-diacetylchitobiose transport system permease protein